MPRTPLAEHLKYVAFIETMFPDYVVGGIDPGYLLHPRDQRFRDSFTLSERAVIRLKEVVQSLSSFPEDTHV